MFQQDKQLALHLRLHNNDQLDNYYNQFMPFPFDLICKYLQRSETLYNHKFLQDNNSQQGI